VNGLTEVVITKLDVLSGLDELQLATAYDVDGQRVHTMPLNTAAMERAVPVYETLSGWREDISQARHMDDLPVNARRYIERLETLLSIPITMISVGPERDQAIRK